MTLTDIYCRINRARGMEVSEHFGHIAFLVTTHYFSNLISQEANMYDQTARYTSRHRMQRGQK